MNPMNSFDKTHKILTIHKNSMMGDMRKFVDQMRESGLKSGMSEQEFWIVFSFVLHLYSVYSTCKMVQNPGDMPRTARNSIKLHSAYLAVFGNAVANGANGPSLEEILAAAGKM